MPACIVDEICYEHKYEKNPTAIIPYFTGLLFFCIYTRSHLDFEHIATADGLSQSDIQSILQDSRGFMWFGTWEGLNKYDGYTIKVFKNNPADQNSISNNFINSIAESKNNDRTMEKYG